MLYPQKNLKRELECMDGLWDFKIGDDIRQIAVPASWNEQYNDLFDYFGKAEYSKKIFIPEYYKDKAVYLRFGSVASKAEVFANGESVCYHEGTALPFECKIDTYLKFGSENLISVIVDNSLDPWALPPAVLHNNEGRVGFFNSYPPVTYDFFPYGGIQRSVYVYTTSPVSIKNIKIDTDINGDVDFSVIFSDKVTGCLNAYIENKSVNIEIDSADNAKGRIKIENPRLWDIGKPELYDLKLELFKDDELIDTYVQNFGIRKIEIVDNSLLLNNRKIFLKGFGKHEDFHIIGKGFNNAVMVKDFSLLKWIGANSFRTSHYPYDEQILSYADQNGILVIGETPFVGLNERMYTESILDKANGIIREMIDRDYNHPSVIMWSLANEPNAESDEAELFFKSMYETARDKDKSRPITYVAHLEPKNNRGMKYYDLICINKYYGWYLAPGQIDNTLDELSDCLDLFHIESGKGVIVAEFGADAIAGMHTDPPQMFSEEYQTEIIKKQYEVIKSKDYVMGAHVWAFAEFKTAQSISRIILNRKGVFTRDRQPKMAAHMLKKLWK